MYVERRFDLRRRADAGVDRDALGETVVDHTRAEPRRDDELRAGVPRRVPPPLPACAADDPLEAPRIASPQRNVTYALRRSAPDERIALEASVAADVQQVFWFDGRALIGVRRVSEGALPWRPADGGARTIRVVDDHGRSSERDVTVQIGR